LKAREILKNIKIAKGCIGKNNKIMGIIAASIIASVTSKENAVNGVGFLD
jgi:hypothetical protein